MPKKPKASKVTYGTTDAMKYKVIEAKLDRGLFMVIVALRLSKKEILKLCTLWNTKKDDLSLQSPETIDFLYQVLCENTNSTE